MEPYRYSLLAEGSIRLLRLLPDPDKQARIHCDLFTFPLADSGSTCPYEALSYVWGSEEKPFSITVNDEEIKIGENLHAALSSLRHSTLERTIWIDALCINQDDATEKGHQVQSMAKIYAKASSVIVWLGKAAYESDKALEEICAAAIKHPRNKRDPERVLYILRRPWFERIWVLQEVAAARHVLIRCGSTEIDGHAFCSGLSALRLSYVNCKSLQPLIASVMYLIRGAIFRPRYAGVPGHQFSLDIHPLSELVEMYHTRKATDRRDKVYALLGMSSDDTGLVVDYTSPWSHVFEALIKYTLSRTVSVKTWNDRELAIIEGKCSILGEVSTIGRDNAWEDSQTLVVVWKNTFLERFRTSIFTIQACSKSIETGDVVCLFQGATRPTIIRPCGLYWTVIMISLPTHSIQHKNGIVQNEATADLEWFQQLQSVARYPRDLVLIWDWGTHLSESIRNQEARYGNLVTEKLGADSLVEMVHNITSLTNMGLVLRDLQKYAESESHIRNALGIFEKALKHEKEPISASSTCERGAKVASDIEAIADALLQVKGGWLPIKWASDDGHYSIIKLMMMKADPKLIDDEGLTPLSWASQNGYLAVVKLLLGTGAINPDARDKGGWRPLLWAASNGHEEIVKLLLDTQMVKADTEQWSGEVGGTRRTPLLLASKGGHEAVVKMLLDIDEVDLDARDENRRTPLIWAVRNEHVNVVRMLLQTGRVDPDASEEGDVEDEGGRTSLMWAANNRNKHIVNLLLRTRRARPDARDACGRTALSLAAERGDAAVVQSLLDTGNADAELADNHGRTPLRFAAEGGFDEVVQLLLDTNEVNPNSKDKDGRTPISAAAMNSHERIVSLLVERNELSLQDLQRRKLIPSKHEFYLDIRDKDYFVMRCQMLFNDVRNWVIRFSHASEMRTWRPEIEINDKTIIDRLNNTMLNGTDVEVYLSNLVRRRDVFTSLTINIIWENIFSCYLFGLDHEQTQNLQSLEEELLSVGILEIVRKWRSTCLTLMSRRVAVERKRDEDAEAVTETVCQTLCSLVTPPRSFQAQLRTQLRRVVTMASQLAVDMRTQKADYLMLPPPQPEFNEDGNIHIPLDFNAKLMNECGGYEIASNEELESQASKVEIVLFPRVIKRGDDDGFGEEEIVIYPAQVTISRKIVNEEKAIQDEDIPGEETNERVKPKSGWMRKVFTKVK